MNIRLSKCLIVLVLIGFAGCFNPYKGDFGFKKANETVYHKNITNLAFPANEEIDWIYNTSYKGKPYSLQIIIQKKEIVWAIVKMENEIVSMEKNNLYGKIENLDSGIYKLMIVDKDKLISEIEFEIFSE